MAILLYDLGLFLYTLFMRVAALWSPKIRLGIRGRIHWRKTIAATLRSGEKRIWIHAASLGEFEQGRPLLDKLKKDFPSHKIVLTFFSPSGYEKMREYKNADYIFYLPIDSRRNARDFINLTQPELAIFIKYEFWYHYLETLNKKNISSILISAAFRESQPFFKWYGNLFRKMLSFISVLFVQDEASAGLLHKIGITKNVFVTGDTRYDRVAEIALSVRSILLVEQFKGDKKLLIAGSTWAEDENILKKSIDALDDDWKLILAPHEIDAASIERVRSFFGEGFILFSAADKDEHIDSRKIMVIDNIGMLSGLYSYGDIAYIGGGFEKSGIHNVLEPAVFGLPVIFGPHYKKFVEAVTLVNEGYAFPVHNADETKSVLLALIFGSKTTEPLRNRMKNFMKQNEGATEKIAAYIRDKKLLTISEII